MRHVVIIFTPHGLTEKRSGEIAELIGLSPATTSEYLSQLFALGLVSSRREGTSIYYRIADHLIARTFHDLLAALDIHCASWSAHNEKSSCSE
ncbi:ArsR/SmtB family transcription factor [Reticulibacter mediterranei]|uniref:ArsR/SmtB family transcription factor n=1 Tax=Reticulibacter mediterranei TaxID=2778369 RepID=UPI001C69215C|nr:helix-turn-helix domain-containing protein [Reticulibacter mediterranei]